MNNLLAKGNSKIKIIHENKEVTINKTDSIKNIITKLGIQTSSSQDVYLLYKTNPESMFQRLNKTNNLVNGSTIFSFVRDKENNNEENNTIKFVWNKKKNKDGSETFIYANKKSIFQEPYYGIHSTLEDLYEQYNVLSSFDGSTKEKCLSYYYSKNPLKDNAYNIKENKFNNMVELLGINLRIIKKGESKLEENKRKEKNKK